MAEACPKGQGGHDLPPPPKKPKVTKDPVSPDRAICIICNTLLTKFVEGNSNCGHVPVNQPGSFLGNLFQLPGLDAPLPFVLSYLFRKPGVQERKAAMARKRSADPSLPLEDNLPLSPLQDDPQFKFQIRRVVCGACVGPVRNAYIALANLDERVSREGAAFKEFLKFVVVPHVVDKKEEKQQPVPKAKSRYVSKTRMKKHPSKVTKCDNQDKKKVDVAVNTDKKLMKTHKFLVTKNSIRALVHSGNKRKLAAFLAGVTWALRREMRRLSLKIHSGQSELSMREVTENGLLPDDEKVSKELEQEFPLLKTAILALGTLRRTFGWSKLCTTVLCVLAKSFNTKVNGLQATVALALKRLGVHKDAYHFFGELGLCASYKSLTSGIYFMPKSQNQTEGQGQSVQSVQAETPESEDQRLRGRDENNVGEQEEQGTAEDKGTSRIGAEPEPEKENGPPPPPVSTSELVAYAAAKSVNLPRRQLWVKNKPMNTPMEDIKSFSGKSSMEEYVMEVELKRQEHEMTRKALEETRRRKKASGIVAKSKALLAKRVMCSTCSRKIIGTGGKKIKKLNTEENRQATMKIVRKMTTAVKRSPFAPVRKKQQKRKESGADVGD